MPSPLVACIRVQFTMYPMVFFRAQFARFAGRIAALGLVLATHFAIEGALAADHFVPGEIWKDTDGQPINAHGGGILFHKGTYYWYGESKIGRTYLPDCNKSWGGTRVDVTGVSCYSSTNLYDWRNEGLVLRAETNSAEHDLHTSKVLERPKVIYNRATSEFVMWMHVDSTDYSAARVGIAVSAKATGPFRYLESFRPDAGAWPLDASEDDKKPSATNALARDFLKGQMARDMTVFVDDNGKAYLFYASEENATMHVSELTADYHHTSGKYARIFIGRSMEAPAVFKRGGKYYIVASGCTAWAPNAARMGVADAPLGPWRELANPCVGDDAEKTFFAQSAFVLPIHGRDDRFIFIADRWNQWNLPESRYVWLPLEFSPDGGFTLGWHNTWQLPDTREFARSESAN